MPKFSKKCSNPLHNDRVKDFHHINLIDPRARGLAKVVNAFKNTVAAGCGVRMDKTNATISNLCLKKSSAGKENLQEILVTQNGQLFRIRFDVIRIPIEI